MGSSWWTERPDHDKRGAMKSKLDYNFFDKSLRDVRKLRGYHHDVLLGSEEIRNDASGSPAARIVQEADEFGNCIFEATSYATVPGHGLSRLQESVRHPLPPEFIAFYEKYEKALAITLAYPLYLWPEEKIMAQRESLWGENHENLMSSWPRKNRIRVRNAS
jgi:hypothetical protein